MISFDRMKIRINPGTVIKSTAGNLGCHLGGTCYIVRALQYIGKGRWKAYHKNGRINMKAQLDATPYSVVDVDPTKVVEETYLLIESAGCTMEFAYGCLYLEDAVLGTMEKHTEIEYAGNGVFYSDTGVEV